MQQLSIEFFWPLTEQIPLDLDYEGCERPKISVPINAGGNYAFSLPSSVGTTITASHLVLDIETTKIKVKEEPGICRKILYKCLGLQWERK